MAGYADEQVAWVVHEASRALQGVAGDSYVSDPWTAIDAELRECVLDGVRRARERPGQSPAELHAGWIAWKAARGWRYGPVKDELTRTHPCMRPWHELAPGQRMRDVVFLAIVAGMDTAGVQ